MNNLILDREIEILNRMGKIDIWATRQIFYDPKKSFHWEKITLEPKKITKVNLGNGWERIETITEEKIFKREYKATF